MGKISSEIVGGILCLYLALWVMAIAEQLWERIYGVPIQGTRSKVIIAYIHAAVAYLIDRVLNGISWIALAIFFFAATREGKEDNPHEAIQADDQLRDRVHQ